MVESNLSGVDPFRLTARQVEVLRLLPNHSRKEIARELGVKLATVKRFLSSDPDGMYARLGVKNRTQAVMEGIRLEIIDLEKFEFPGMERFPWE